MSLFNLFASDNKRNLAKLEKMVQKIEDLAPVYEAMDNDTLRAQTNVLKDRLQKGETLDDILYDAFAVVREASSRVLNMRHFHYQLMGGIVLHQGRIAEMMTGEGKTIVATLPAYLNALSGKGVHVVTVNEYLSGVGAEIMGKVYRFLGLTVGCSFSNMTPEQKRKAYECDITYSTNNELAFDYLRDNLVRRAKDRMCRGYNFAIVDEVDSILIDEARNPLIISGRGFKSSDQYAKAQRFIRNLKRDEDYTVDEEKKAVHLTELGTEKAERYFDVETLSDVGNVELNQHILNALRANFIMKAESDYIVRDGKVLIVDQFTGRIMEGRRYSNGLHQAIEAKENLQVKDELLTVATITLQNFFKMYKKLSGMTGTAKTEETEFNKIYSLDIVSIPTNLPMIRIDEPDVIYTSIKGKLKAVVDRIAEAYERGQPVLVGTVTIERSEELSKLLKGKGIPHKVLNAKNHAQEAEIVAQAGRVKTVTIATNMAGRGTDILLGGNPEYLAKSQLYKMGYNQDIIDQATSFLPIEDEKVAEAKQNYDKYLASYKEQTDKEKEEVINLGGLLVIGTERHESRRIDNQLRGRAGRQGDPGRSVFYISLEDDLVRIFGGDRLKSISNFFKIDDDTPFQMKALSNQIERAQKKVEARNYASRRNVLEFDDVINKQRNIIYTERNKILDGEDVHEQIRQMFPDVISEALSKSVNMDKPSFEWDLAEINRCLEDKLYPKGANFVTEEMLEDTIYDELYEDVLNDVYKRYDEKKAEVETLGVPFFEVERSILLDMVDNAWMEHIDAMSTLSHEIVVQSLGRQDPIVAYKKEGFAMFDEMISNIREKTSTILLNIMVRPAVPQPQPKQMDLVTSAGGKEVKSNGQAKSSKVGRNDPCPCGSGRKYKNCCGKNE
ncbi:MAG: preprotein translocase subunit SecA [Clostridia bacterium]|nr:preprotein translocase subunit SecA [Clostridia bacterium]